MGLGTTAAAESISAKHGVSRLPWVCADEPGECVRCLVLEQRPAELCVGSKRRVSAGKERDEWDEREWNRSVALSAQLGCSLVPRKLSQIESSWSALESRLGLVGEVRQYGVQTSAPCGGLPQALMLVQRLSGLV
jgi:hypothetical protein